MPPVMGAGAFVMSEMTGIPYLEIIKVAAIPGILFFLSVGVMIYFESKKLGLHGLPAEELPRSRDVWRRGWYLLLPIAVLIAVMVSGYSPQMAVLYGVISTIVVSWFRKETRMGPGQIWLALVEAGKQCLFVAALVGAVGVLIGVLSLTGIVIRFPYVLVDLAGNSVLLTIGLIAVRDVRFGFAAADHGDLSRCCRSRSSSVIQAWRAGAFSSSYYILARASTRTLRRRSPWGPSPRRRSPGRTR